MPLAGPVILSVVIPAWNGRALLQRHLPGVIDALRTLDERWECLVVDDGSTDGTAAYLTERHPEVRVVRREQNRGFSSAVNLGIAASVGEFVWLLNNDMDIPVDLPRRLLEAFREGDAGGNLFAVSVMQDYVGKDGASWPGGMSRVVLERGLLDITDVTAKLTSAEMDGGAPLPVTFTCAGCAIYRREKLLALGGFSELLDPFYAEDLEISLQASRRGWRQLFAAGLRVRHFHGSSAGKKPFRIWLVPMRNRILATWMLLDSPVLWRRHAREFAAALAGWTLRGRIRPLLALVYALARLPGLRRERAARRRGASVPLADTMMPAADSPPSLQPI